MKKNEKRIINIDKYYCKLEIFAYFLIAFGSLGIIIYEIYIVVSSLIMK